MGRVLPEATQLVNVNGGTGPGPLVLGPSYGIAGTAILGPVFTKNIPHPHPLHRHHHPDTHVLNGSFPPRQTWI